MIRLGTSQSIPMRFETNDTERMRMLLNDGKFYYATTSQGPHGGFFNINASNSSRNGINVQGTTGNYVMVSSAGGSTGRPQSIYFYTLLKWQSGNWKN